MKQASRGQAVISTLWVAVTTGSAVFMALVANFALRFGGPATRDNYVDAAKLFALAGGILCAGPIGAWLVLRRRVWLVISIVLFALTAAFVGYLLVRSRSAPTLTDLLG